jgi:hypothetical protein
VSGCHQIHVPHAECGGGEKSCQHLQGRLGRDPEFLLKIITGDEMWVYKPDPETKQQSSQWKSLLSPLTERQDKFAEMRRAFTLFPLTLMELCIMNLFHKDKL